MEEVRALAVLIRAPRCAKFGIYARWSTDVDEMGFGIQTFLRLRLIDVFLLSRDFFTSQILNRALVKWQNLSRTLIWSVLYRERDLLYTCTYNCS